MEADDNALGAATGDSEMKAWLLRQPPNGPGLAAQAVESVVKTLEDEECFFVTDLNLMIGTRAWETKFKEVTRKKIEKIIQPSSDAAYESKVPNTDAQIEVEKQTSVAAAAEARAAEAEARITKLEEDMQKAALASQTRVDCATKEAQTAKEEARKAKEEAQKAKEEAHMAKERAETLVHDANEETQAAKEEARKAKEEVQKAMEEAVAARMAATSAESELKVAKEEARRNEVLRKEAEEALSRRKMELGSTAAEAAPADPMPTSIVSGSTSMAGAKRKTATAHDDTDPANRDVLSKRLHVEGIPAVPKVANSDPKSGHEAERFRSVSATTSDAVLTDAARGKASADKTPGPTQTSAAQLASASLANALANAGARVGKGAGPPGLSPTAILLHKGGALDRDGASVGDAGMRVRQVVTFYQKTGKETALVLHANGFIRGFTRVRPSAVGQASTAPPSPPNALTASSIGSELAFAPLGFKLSAPHSNAIDMHPSSIHKLVKTEKYEIPHEKLAAEQTLTISTKLEVMFEDRMPTLLKTSAQGLSMHPLDNNLYAVGCTDGTIVIKNFHFVDKNMFQVIGEPLDSEQEVPPAHIFFTPQGKALVVCSSTPEVDIDSKRWKLVTLLQVYEVPEYAVSPGARRAPPVSRESFPMTEEGTRRYYEEKKRIKKKEDEDKKKEIEAWVKENERAGRGDRLFASHALNTIELTRGHPLAMLPRPTRKNADGQDNQKEAALILWQEAAELWFVAGNAIQNLATRLISGITCATELEWHLLNGASAHEGNGGSSSSILYWLVGTCHGEVHVLHGEDLRAVPLPVLADGEPSAGSSPSINQQTGGIVLRTSLHTGSSEAPMPITSLSINSAAMAEGDASRSEAVLLVGSEDGSLRQFRLVDLMRAA